MKIEYSEQDSIGVYIRYLIDWHSAILFSTSLEKIQWFCSKSVELNSNGI